MENKKELEQLLNEYNQTWYDKDIERLRAFYDANVLIYFDNHQGNDTFDVEEHLNLVRNFFENGKATVLWHLGKKSPH